MESSWVVFTGLAFFPPQAFSDGSAQPDYTIFPPHRPRMINPGVNIVPKLAERSLFLEAGQMTENPLSSGFRSCWWPSFHHGDGRSRGGWATERDEGSGLEENNEMRGKARILVPISASDSNLFLKQDRRWPFDSVTHSGILFCINSCYFH